MKKGDVPTERIFILIGVALICLIFLTSVFTRTLTPSLKSSDEARVAYYAHTLASYMSMLSSVDQGLIERDFEEQCDVEIIRKKPSYYAVKVTVYKKGSEKETKIFPPLYAQIECEKYCRQYKCKCESCSVKGECKIVNLEKSVTSDEVPFIGFVDIDPKQKSIIVSKTRYVSLRKDPTDKAVKLEKAEEISFCSEPLESEVKYVIETYGNKYKVDETIIRSVITGESGFRHCGSEGDVMTSFTGTSYGIMQLKPSTAIWIAEKNNENVDYKNPLDNIKAGIMYLNYTRGRMEPYTQGEDLDRVMVANYNCEAIYKIVKTNCTKGELGCWDKVEKYIHSTESTGTYCQGEKGDETYNYVRRIFNQIKPCFEKNPNCYYACYYSTCKKRDWEVN